MSPRKRETPAGPESLAGRPAVVAYENRKVVVSIIVVLYDTENGMDDRDRAKHVLYKEPLSTPTT